MPEAVARAPLAAVPTLDAIAAHPELVATLPTSAVRALHMRAVVTLAALAPALVEPSRADVPTSGNSAEYRPVRPKRKNDDVADGDTPKVKLHAAGDLLDIEQAAARLGVSTSWLYKRARALPFTVRIGAVLRFDPRGLTKYIADRAGSTR